MPKVDSSELGMLNEQANRVFIVGSIGSVVGFEPVIGRHDQNQHTEFTGQNPFVRTDLSHLGGE